MPTRNWMRIVIGLFAGIMFTLSLITGNSIDKDGYHWIAGVSSAVIILLLIYDRWVWRWPLIRKLAERSGRPVIHGTWKGTLEFARDANGEPGTIELYFSIDQTYSSVTVRGFFTTSESHSLTATIDRPLSNQKRLVFAYHSEAPHPARNKNRPHDGTVMLNIIGIPVESLSGSYYTDRGGSGKIRLTEYHPKLSESYDQAAARSYKKRA